jgi:hypothetical protein
MTPDKADRPIVSRLAVELAVAAITAGLGLAVVIGAIEYQIGWDDAGPQPGYVPFYVGLIIILGSIGVAVQAWRARERAGPSFLTVVQARRVATFALPILVFVGVSLVTGLYVATALYLMATMMFQGGYRWPRAVLTSVAIAIVFFVLFEIGFKQPLLKGPLEAWLGFH